MNKLNARYISQSGGNRHLEIVNDHILSAYFFQTQRMLFVLQAGYGVNRVSGVSAARLVAAYSLLFLTVEIYLYLAHVVIAFGQIGDTGTGKGDLAVIADAAAAAVAANMGVVHISAFARSVIGIEPRAVISVSCAGCVYIFDIIQIVVVNIDDLLIHIIGIVFGGIFLCQNFKGVHYHGLSALFNKLNGMSALIFRAADGVFEFQAGVAVNRLLIENIFGAGTINRCFQLTVDVDVDLAHFRTGFRDKLHAVAGKGILYGIAVSSSVMHVVQIVFPVGSVFAVGPVAGINNIAFRIVYSMVIHGGEFGSSVLIGSGSFFDQNDHFIFRGLKFHQVVFAGFDGFRFDAVSIQHDTAVPRISDPAGFSKLRFDFYILNFLGFDGRGYQETIFREKLIFGIPRFRPRREYTNDRITVGCGGQALVQPILKRRRECSVAFRGIVVSLVKNQVGGIAVYRKHLILSVQDTAQIIAKAQLGNIHMEPAGAVLINLSALELIQISRRMIIGVESDLPVSVVKALISCFQIEDIIFFQHFEDRAFCAVAVTNKVVGG